MLEATQKIMHKVMLVDDEHIFIEFMGQIIDWEEFGCHVVGTASDGLEAYEQIPILQPDILFLDINMARMDGLTLCGLLQQLSNPPTIIITTSHDEFSFAQKAIQLNVLDYLLKPFDKTQLIESLQKAIVRQKSNRYYGELELEQNQRRISDFFLDQISQGSTSNTPPPSYLAKKSFLLSSSRFKESGIVVKDEILSLLHHRTAVFGGQHYFLTLQNGKLYLLHIFPQGEQEKQIVEAISQVFTEIEKVPKTSLSPVVDSVDQLRSAFEKVDIAMDNSIKSDDKVVSFDTLDISNCGMPTYSDADIRSLVKHFEALQYDEADRAIEAIFGLTGKGNFSIQFTVSIYHSILVSIYARYSMQPLSSGFSADTSKKFAQHLGACTTADEALTVIKNGIHEVFSDCLNRKPITKQGALVEQIDEYLRTHYASPGVSVTQVADALFYEGSYLRRIYKGETGKTIMSQLETIRIERAQELISQYQHKIGEVAELVGYSNQFYFSRRFKLLSGENPSDYEARFY